MPLEPFGVPSRAAIQGAIDEGGMFVPFTPSWSGVTLGSGAVNEGRITRVGNRVEGYFMLALGTGGAVTATMLLTMPFLARTQPTRLAIGSVFMEDSGSVSTRRGGTMFQASAINAAFLIDNDPAGSAQLGAGTPWAWGPTDVLSGTFCYEAA
jgi:hypothetical protein